MLRDEVTLWAEVTNDIFYRDPYAYRISRFLRMHTKSRYQRSKAESEMMFGYATRTDDIAIDGKGSTNPHQIGPMSIKIKNESTKCMSYRMVVAALLLLSVAVPVSAQDTPSRPHLPSQHDKSSNLRQQLRMNANPDDVVSCGSCCYRVETAKAPLDTFYKKMIDLNGFLIASSGDVRDAALYEAALTVDNMVRERPDLLQILAKETVILAVIGKDEVTRDIPDYSFLPPDWDIYRGLGATAGGPTTSCAEENLLCLNDDVYRGENICIHETAHTLAGSGGKLPTVRRVDGENLDQKIRSIYRASVTNGGLWSGTYAATNHEEMWAEAVQSFYNANFGEVNTRSKLKGYDPKLYEVIEKVFGPKPLNTCPTNKCDCSTFVCPSESSSTPAPPPVFCFSGSTLLHVKDKGPVRMDQVEVGDFVQTDRGFDLVYAFGHRNRDIEADYLSIYTKSHVPLEISANHMVFVEREGTSKFIPAQSLIKGDLVITGDGGVDMVINIGKTRSRGVFAPLTASGTVVVNGGIVASSYISLQGEMLQIGTINTPVNMQWVAHSFLTPYRVICTSFRRCEEEDALVYFLPLAEWLVQQNTCTMFVLSVPLLAYLALVSLLEAFLTNTYYAVVVVLMGVAYAYYVKMNAVAKNSDL